MEAMRRLLEEPWNTVFSRWQRNNNNVDTYKKPLPQA